MSKQTFGYMCLKCSQVNITTVILCGLKFGNINIHSLKEKLISIPKSSLAHLQMEVTWPFIQAYGLLIKHMDVSLICNLI